MARGPAARGRKLTGARRNVASLLEAITGRLTWHSEVMDAFGEKVLRSQGVLQRAAARLPALQKGMTSAHDAILATLTGDDDSLRSAGTPAVATTRTLAALALASTAGARAHERILEACASIGVLIAGADARRRELNMQGIMEKAYTRDPGHVMPDYDAGPTRPARSPLKEPSDDVKLIPPPHFGGGSGARGDVNVTQHFHYKVDNREAERIAVQTRRLQTRGRLGYAY